MTPNTALRETSQAVREGRVAEAYDLIRAAVRAAPGDGSLRLALVELLCVQGDWERALAQLQTLASLGFPTTEKGYAPVIAAEMAREKALRGLVEIRCLGPRPEWLGRWQAATVAATADDLAPLQSLRAELQGQGMPDPGEVDGTPVNLFADSDSRFAPIFEIILDGTYQWLPMRNCTGAMFMGAVKSPLEFLWRQVVISVREAGQFKAVMPARLPFSHSPSLPGNVRLAQQIEWLETAPATVNLARGQRVFVSDAGSHPISVTERMWFGQPTDAGPTEAPAAAAE